MIFFSAPGASGSVLGAPRAGSKSPVGAQEGRGGLQEPFWHHFWSQNGTPRLHFWSSFGALWGAILVTFTLCSSYFCTILGAKMEPRGFVLGAFLEHFGAVFPPHPIKSQGAPHHEYPFFKKGGYSWRGLTRALFWSHSPFALSGLASLGYLGSAGDRGSAYNF